MNLKLSRVVSLVACVCALMPAPSAIAQNAASSPTPPPPPPRSTTSASQTTIAPETRQGGAKGPVTVSAALTKPFSGVPAGALNRLVALRLEEGKAIVKLDGNEIALKAGDAIDGGVVKAIGPSRIVVQRTTKDDAVLYLINFDSEGKPTIQAIGSRLKATAPAPPR